MEGVTLGGLPPPPSDAIGLDHKTASTIATSIVHSKLDYCNSLFYNLYLYLILN